MEGNSVSGRKKGGGQKPLKDRSMHRDWSKGSKSEIRETGWGGEKKE